jgi:hypothetical protein
MAAVKKDNIFYAEAVKGYTFKVTIDSLCSKYVVFIKFKTSSKNGSQCKEKRFNRYFY